MELKEITADRFATLFDRHAMHVYNTVAFNELNRHKVNAVRYLAFCNPDPRLGIILGETPGRLLSPFSAPFGGFTLLPHCSSTDLDEAIQLLADMGRVCGCTVEITLPPSFYAPEQIKAQERALNLHGAMMWNDVNHHRRLDFSHGQSADRFSRNSRSQLRKAIKAGFRFEILDSSTDSIKRVYDVVLANHSALGYPVKMSLDEVIRTTPLVGSKFMIVTLEDVDVAAAMVNGVTPRVVQAIYWGDILQFRPLRPMNLLAAFLLNKCRDWGYDILDFGPSSEFGMPSPGLCHFKQGLGCHATSKPHFRL